MVLKLIGDIWFGCFSEGFVNRGFTVIQNIGHPLSNTELFFPNLICVFYHGKIVQKLVST